jgi:hypothetical protein
VKLILFCEAPADQRMAAALTDRVLSEDGPSWVSDLMDMDPKLVREWSSDDLQRSYFDLHAISKYLQKYKVRPLLGHFDGKPGSADAQMARNIFWLVRAMDRNQQSNSTHDAVLIVRDMDNQSEARRTGLNQAHTEASTWASFKIVIGCPDPEHETWLLASFDAENEEEKRRLEDLRQELGFCPVREAHLANATEDGAKKNPKRLVDVLIGKDPERRDRCLTLSLDELRNRGKESRLTAFLDELREQLLPLLTQSIR